MLVASSMVLSSRQASEAGLGFYGVYRRTYGTEIASKSKMKTVKLDGMLPACPQNALPRRPTGEPVPGALAR